MDLLFLLVWCLLHTTIVTTCTLELLTIWAGLQVTHSQGFVNQKLISHPILITFIPIIIRKCFLKCFFFSFAIMLLLTILILHLKLFKGRDKIIRQQCWQKASSKTKDVWKDNERKTKLVWDKNERQICR